MLRIGSKLAMVYLNPLAPQVEEDPVDLLGGIGVFDSADGWSNGGGWAVGSGVLTATATSSSFYREVLGSTIGLTYRIQFDWTHTSGELRVGLGDTSAGPSYTAITTSGAKDFTLVMGSDGNKFIEFYGGIVTGVMDNLVITEE